MNSIIGDRDSLSEDDDRGAEALYSPNARFRIAVTTVPAGSGQVIFNPVSDQTGEWAPGTIVSLVATGAQSFEFVFWGGDLEGRNNPAVLTLDRDKILRANFQYVPPPFIKSPPVSRQVNAGANVTFKVKAKGKKPLTYQWYFNGSAIPGAITSKLVLPAVQPGQTGSYMVRITDAVRGTTTASAELVVVSIN